MKNVINNILSAVEDISVGLLIIILAVIGAFGPWIAVLAIGFLL